MNMMISTRAIHWIRAYSRHSSACERRFRGALITAVVSIAVGTIAQGQYFTPFHVASKKLFAQPAPVTPAYSMAFDSAFAAGADSIYFHFGALDQEAGEDVPGCVGWGDPFCYKANKPIWSGSLFLTDNNGTYWMRNTFGDSLRFDLNILPGDTAVFFQDATQQFSLVKSGPDTLSILDFIDSVYTYTIVHTDLNHQPIASALNGGSLIVGKQLGLIRFFRIDSFPQVLEPLELIGNKGPDLGLHRITSAMVHDHQPGDIVQTKSFDGFGYPPLPFSYTKISILARFDSPDSVEYEIEWETFNAAGTSFNSGAGTSRYSKQDVLAELPFERFNGSHITLNRASTCGIAIWRLSSEVLPGIWPCPEGDCWVNGDTGGPPPQSSSWLHLGLAETHYYFQTPFNSWDQPYWDIKSLVYYRKDGVDCGTQQYLGIADAEISGSVTVAPMPSTGPITISSSRIIRSLTISDSQGRAVLALNPRSTIIRVDLSALTSGTYHLLLIREDDRVVHRQIMLIR